MPRTLTVALCIGGLWGGGLACRPAEVPEPVVKNSAPNVLLVTLDTTRADHIGAYGAKKVFTPTLDRLARESFKFNRAFATVSLTQPSHASIMTGLFPHYHGVRDNSHFVLKAEATTLAEALHDAGFQTAAFVAAFVLDGRFGLDQGFDVYDDETRPKHEFEGFRVPERNGQAVTDAAMAWLDETSADKPYFLWAHYYDPHMPYDAPASFTRYQGHPYDVEIAYTDTQLARLLEHVRKLDAERSGSTMVVVTADHGDALSQYGEPTHGYFAYDSTLHIPLIVHVPAGKATGETDCVVSLVDIMPTVLDLVGLPVPGPNDMHGRSLKPLMDEVDAADAEAALARRPIAVESYESHFSHGWAPLEGVRVGEVKYIHAPKPELYLLAENPREGARNNRYAERAELAAEMEGMYRDLYDTQLSFPSMAAAPQAPDPEAIEKLRALGYVASELPEADAATSELDLKDMLPFFKSVLRAMALIGAGDAIDATELLIELHREQPKDPKVITMLANLAAQTPWAADLALPVIESAVRTPGVVSANHLPQILACCGRIYFNRGENERAYTYFDEALKAQADLAGAVWWQGMTALRLDRAAEAVAMFQRAQNTYDLEAHHIGAALGLARFHQGNKKAGAATWQALLDAAQPDSPAWWLAARCPLDSEVCAVVAPSLAPLVDETSLPEAIRAAAGIAYSNYCAVLGEHRRALDALDRVAPLLGDGDIDLRIARGRQLLRLGDEQAARQILEDSFEQIKDRVDAMTALASLLEQAGEVDRAVTIFEDLYARHPEHVGVMNNLAWLLCVQGQDVHRALRIIRIAIARRGSDPDVNHTAGWIYRTLGEKQMALRHLERSVEIDPRNAEHHYHFGVAWRDVGRHEEAGAAFTRAVELVGMDRPSWYADAVDGMRTAE